MQELKILKSFYFNIEKDKYVVIWPMSVSSKTRDYNLWFKKLLDDKLNVGDISFFNEFIITNLSKHYMLNAKH